MHRKHFSIHLLGGFELTGDGVRLDVPMSSQRLIGFLALHDRALARAYVAASLWPETTEEKASANLRTALWRLHRPDLHLLDSRNGHLSLDAEVWIDVRALRHAARDHRRTGHLPDDDRLIDLRGELMPGCWDGWLVFERERLRQEAAHLCEARCAACLRDGDVHRAVLHALTAVECDPLRESANAWLVRAHLAGGNRADAMRHARSYAVMLRDELGIDPPEHLEALCWSSPESSVSMRG